MPLQNYSTMVDLLLWSHDSHNNPPWTLGQVGHLPFNVQLGGKKLLNWAENSQAEYLLLWSPEYSLPNPSLLIDFIKDGLDIAHAGLKQGMGEFLPDLHLIIQDWSMINGAVEKVSNSWRLSLETCLIRRNLLITIGGMDLAFEDINSAGLELGYRSIKLGALVEYRPELLSKRQYSNISTARRANIQDRYSFVLRHYGKRWSQYLLLRRLMGSFKWLTEWQAWQQALQVCTTIPSPALNLQPVWYETNSSNLTKIRQSEVSVIIPTLGRYPYLPAALNSLQRQTVKPQEVIVVDQNPPELRQPKVYKGYEDLNLQVIWQDERGQSLARNTGLEIVSSPYVFLFDDDSIAADDLIENHLRMIINGRFHVSTGVAYPPQPSDYELPPDFRYPRVAQTFDTGNSLLPLDLARRMGGLDRNYDFGPGTDTDFGTRLYLAGVRIAHNPNAKRIHFKAPMGGLRIHGSHKYNSDLGLLQPFPPITQTYYGLRYLKWKQYRERFWLQFVTSKFSKELRHNEKNMRQKLRILFIFFFLVLFLPIKWYLSYRQAKRLLKQGVRLANF